MWWGLNFNLRARTYTKMKRNALCSSKQDWPSYLFFVVLWRPLSALLLSFFFGWYYSPPSWPLPLRRNFSKRAGFLTAFQRGVVCLSNELGFSVESSLRVIEFFFVQTKQFVGSHVNVNLTRQTCSQCSSMSARSKHQALGNKFSVQICYVFLLSKCRGDWDRGLCTFWVLSCRELLRNDKIWFFLWPNTSFLKVVTAKRFSIRKYPKSAHT